MSALPIVEPFRDASVASPVTTLRRPSSRVGVKIQSRSRRRAAQAALIQAAVLVSVGSVAFLSSCLAGQVMVEKSRREGIEASTRLRSALKTQAALETRVERLSSVSAINQWAVSRGYRAPEDIARSSEDQNLVALIQ